MSARAGPEGLAKTSKTALQLHKNRPHFRVKAWAGYTFCVWSFENELSGAIGVGG